MSHRRRILGATLALVIIFLVLTTRRSTGAHPRDLRGLRDVDERDGRLAQIKEPPGDWDPAEDRFVDQQGDGVEGKGLQEQIDEIARQMDDLPDEPIQRKTPKKNNQQQQQQQKTVEDDSEGADTGRVGGVAQVDGVGAPVEKVEKAEEKPAQNVYDAADDYRVILTQAPIIIFSKTGCPHSRDAKRILLETHKFNPVPFIVELDKHPHGPLLQAHVRSVTGRGTVPNVIVNGQSIGGGDEMRSLEAGGRIAETFLQRLPGQITVDGQSAP